MSSLPVHAESLADWYLYMMTDTETNSIPSPKTTIAKLSSLTVHLICGKNAYVFIIQVAKGLKVAREPPPMSGSPGS